jgi:hypothetical protein
MTMKRNLNVFIIIPSVFTICMLSSCIKNLDNYELKEKPKKLVIHGACNPDSLLKVYITRSLPYFSKESFDINKEVTVSVYSEGEFIETLADQGQGWFASESIYPEAGHSYEIVAEAPGYESVRSTFRIPGNISAEFIKTTFSEHHYEDCNICSPELFLYITFNIEDNGTDENFYSVSLLSHQKVYLWGEKEIYDPLSGGYYYDYVIVDSLYSYSPLTIETNEHIVDIEKWGNYYGKVTPDYYPSGDELIFRDIHFNGQTYSFTLSSSYYFYDEYNNPNSVRLVIKSVDKEFYTYASSMAKVNQSEDNPLAEPAAPYTNVHGGLGMVYGFTTKVIDIDLSDIEMPPDY